jgi:hypothetical protein
MQSDPQAVSEHHCAPPAVRKACAKSAVAVRKP